MSHLNLLLLHVEPQASSRIPFESSTDRQYGLLADFPHFPAVLVSLACAPPPFGGGNHVCF